VFVAENAEATLDIPLVFTGNVPDDTGGDDEKASRGGGEAAGLAEARKFPKALLPKLPVAI